MKQVKRWRLFDCFQGSEASRAVDARECIEWLEIKGFKAKVWAPLPQHKTSGHTHVVVLCNIDDYDKLLFGRFIA